MSTPKPIANWKAIAAMASNRVIGIGSQIPWHLPEDFRWFRLCTLGHIVVLGRKTFEGLGRPLPNRVNLVLTRQPKRIRQAHPELFSKAKIGPGGRLLGAQLEMSSLIPGTVRLVTSLEVIMRRKDKCHVFICGGAQIYRQALPFCSELLLTRVKTSVEGDAFLPPFEHLFEQAEILRDTPEFTIERWRNRQLPPNG